MSQFTYNVNANIDVNMHQVQESQLLRKINVDVSHAYFRNTFVGCTNVNLLSRLFAIASQTFPLKMLS